MKSLPIFKFGALILFAILQRGYGDRGELDSFFQGVPKQSPWLTGPLLTSGINVTPRGFVNIEPYITASVFNGQYNQHWKSVSRTNFYNTNFALSTIIGLTKWMDLNLFPQVNYNRTGHTSSLEFGDLPIGFDFQLLLGTLENNTPGIKLYIQEVFPTGRYQKLRPERLVTDAGGLGSFQTVVGMVIGKPMVFSGLHYFTPRMSIYYDYFSPVNVKGFNVYGGARNTKGRVYPGGQCGALFAFEYSLTKNWAFALDAVSIYTRKTRFRGESGTNPLTGEKAVLKAPAKLQFSIAPAIEYNFSSSLGLIAGPWFTVAGRNSKRFISGIIALNYYGPLSYKK